MIDLKPVTTPVSHNYALEVITAPTSPFPEPNKPMTTAVGIRVSNLDASALDTDVNTLMDVAGVYVELTVLQNEECEQRTCFSWDSDGNAWSQVGLYGTTLSDGLTITCRVEPPSTELVVIGACAPTGSLVGDPYVFAPLSNEWVPFHPSNDQLYSLVQGHDFHVQGGFAPATKSSCQCVWVDSDPSAPPRAGNRLAAVIFEFNGGVFHITSSGLFFQHGGEWTDVPSSEWSPASFAQTGEGYAGSGELLSNDVHVTWGAVTKVKSFPWGDHKYSHQFKADIPSVGKLTVMAGVDNGINVLDVFFDPKVGELDGLIGMALSSDKAGIDAFTSTLALAST